MMLRHPRKELSQQQSISEHGRLTSQEGELEGVQRQAGMFSSGFDQLDASWSHLRSGTAIEEMPY